MQKHSGVVEGTIPGSSEPTSPSLPALKIFHLPHHDTQSRLMNLPLSLGTDQGLDGDRGLCLPQPSLSTRQPRKSHHSLLTLFADVEWMPIHTRASVGTVIGYVYSLGQFLLAGMAYAVPHWRQLQLLVSVPFFAFFIYSWCVGPVGVGGNATEAQRPARDKMPPQISSNTPPHRIREGRT